MPALSKSLERFRAIGYHNELTLEQRVAAVYVDGEHNTFSEEDYDGFDDGLKKKYRAAMLQAVVEGLK
ncbi:hypothetical protein J4E91_007797 [Alternaria rosae]|nr:hypothetical protein J4E91_007797 [Alternaria rosae]